MALLDRIGNRRRRTLTVTAVAIALVAVAGPSPATAAEPPPPTPGASGGDIGVEIGSRPGSEGKWARRPVADGSGGFIYRDGQNTPLDTVDRRITVHLALNDRGQTTGPYFPDGLAGDLGGFVRSRRGNYTRIDVPPGPSTQPLDINDRGTIAGMSGDRETLEGGPFLRKPNGVVTAVKVPGASVNDVNGINNRGAAVGSYVGRDGVVRAYLMDRGTVTTLDPPDSPDDPDAQNVYPADVSDRGQVVGCYADANGTYHGFLYAEGRFETIDPPGGADVPMYATTCAWGINNRGQVVGQYVDATGMLHGYLWQRGRGFETIDPPRGAPVVGPSGIRGTVAIDINDRGEILLPVPGGFYKGRTVPIGG